MSTEKLEKLETWFRRQYRSGKGYHAHLSEHAVFDALEQAREPSQTVAQSLRGDPAHEANKADLRDLRWWTLYDIAQALEARAIGLADAQTLRQRRRIYLLRRHIGRLPAMYQAIILADNLADEARRYGVDYHKAYAIQQNEIKIIAKKFENDAKKAQENQKNVLIYRDPLLLITKKMEQCDEDDQCQASS